MFSFVKLIANKIDKRSNIRELPLCYGDTVCILLEHAFCITGNSLYIVVLSYLAPDTCKNGLANRNLKNDF